MYSRNLPLELQQLRRRVWGTWCPGMVLFGRNLVQLSNAPWLVLVIVPSWSVNYSYILKDNVLQMVWPSLIWSRPKTFEGQIYFSDSLSCLPSSQMAQSFHRLFLVLPLSFLVEALVQTPWMAHQEERLQIGALRLDYFCQSVLYYWQGYWGQISLIYNWLFCYHLVIG